MGDFSRAAHSTSEAFSDSSSFLMGLTLGKATVRLLPPLSAKFVEPLWGQTPLEKLTEWETFPEHRGLGRPEEGLALEHCIGKSQKSLSPNQRRKTLLLD